jgi:hypothetical protein
VKPKGLVSALAGVALCVSSCSLFGSSSPLHGSGNGFFATAADAGSRKYDLAVDVLQNKGPGSIQIVGVTPRTIGRLHIDGAFLLAARDNNPGGGISPAPLPVPAGDSLTPISVSRHPSIRQGSNQYLVIRVNIPPEKASGATLSVVVHYLSGGALRSTTYGMAVAMCREEFVGGECDVIRSQAQAFSKA